MQKKSNTAQNLPNLKKAKAVAIAAADVIMPITECLVGIVGRGYVITITVSLTVWQCFICWYTSYMYVLL